MSDTVTALRPQQARVRDILATGRWTPTTIFMAMHIPRYSSRFAELRDMAPDAYESRLRTHRDRDGKMTSRCADYRFMGRDADITRELYAQAKWARKMVTDGDRGMQTFTVDGVVVLGLLAGQVAMLNDAEIARRGLAAYVDPYASENGGAA